MALLNQRWRVMLTVLVPVLCRLDIICARCVLCGRAASVRPPHRRPRGSIRAAEAGRWLAAQQVWHRDGALWHRFSSSLTAVCGTGQYRCRSAPRSGPACPCWAVTLRRVRPGVGWLSARVLGSPVGASIHVLWFLGDLSPCVPRHSFLWSASSRAVVYPPVVEAGLSQRRGTGRNYSQMNSGS